MSEGSIGIFSSLPIFYFVNQVSWCIFLWTKSISVISILLVNWFMQKQKQNETKQNHTCHDRYVIYFNNRQINVLVVTFECIFICIYKSLQAKQKH